MKECLLAHPALRRNLTTVANEAQASTLNRDKSAILSTRLPFAREWCPHDPSKHDHGGYGVSSSSSSGASGSYGVSVSVSSSSGSDSSSGSTGRTSSLAEPSNVLVVRPHKHTRYMLIPAAAGTADGTLHLDGGIEQMLMGGARPKWMGSGLYSPTRAGLVPLSPQHWSVPQVDFVSWLPASVRDEDYVVLKGTRSRGSRPVGKRRESKSYLAVTLCLSSCVYRLR